MKLHTVIPEIPKSRVNFNFHPSISLNTMDSAEFLVILGQSIKEKKDGVHIEYFITYQKNSGDNLLHWNGSIFTITSADSTIDPKNETQLFEIVKESLRAAFQRFTSEGNQVNRGRTDKVRDIIIVPTEDKLLTIVRQIMTRIGVIP